MIKTILKFMAAVIGIVLFSVVSFADSVSLYSNIDDSSSQCNLLIDAMRSDQTYDPYNEYVVVRAGDRDYRIYFGSDLDQSVAIYYRYTPQYQTMPASMTRGSTNGSLTIIDNGYYYVGNIPGSLSSAQAESYKLGAIITVCGIIVVFLILFKVFRKSSGTNAKYYRVR